MGPGNFTLWLGEGASPTQWSLVDTLYPDPDYGNGQWQAAFSLPDGQYTLKAKADHVHPDSTFEPEHTSTFTVNAGGEQRTLTNTYDQSGRLTSRSWASGSVTQIFTWDATGKLVKVVQDDTRATPLLPDFIWTAVYDPAGRRIKTSYMPGNSPVVGASAARSIHSWYDPMVEFLEIAVESQGKRWWKFHGPDLDSGYGTFQGVGGLEAVIDEQTEAVYLIVDEAFGHVVAYIDLGSLSSNADDQVVWKEIQLSGNGPLPGYQMKPLEESGNLLASLAWQSRRTDPTGFFGMGARYYDPASGSFLSADPLGHDASLDLYSYAGGDPINSLDPTGRTPNYEKVHYPNGTQATRVFDSSGNAHIVTTKNDAYYNSLVRDGEIAEIGASSDLIETGGKWSVGITLGFMGGTLMSQPLFMTQILKTPPVVSITGETVLVAGSRSVVTTNGFGLLAAGGYVTYTGGVTAGGAAAGYVYNLGQGASATAYAYSTTTAGKSALTLGGLGLFSFGYFSDQAGFDTGTTALTGVEGGPIYHASMSLVDIGSATSNTGNTGGNWIGDMINSLWDGLGEQSTKSFNQYLDNSQLLRNDYHAFGNPRNSASNITDPVAGSNSNLTGSH